MSNLGFRFMCLVFTIRDLIRPREEILKEVSIQPGFYVLDYGCGPSSYTMIAAQQVGETGKVYALDVHPLAIQRVQRAASKKGLNNIETIRSDCATGLDDNSVDVVMLYDTFHLLGDQDAVLRELHRVLKPNGILSFSDHHMKGKEIVSEVTSNGLFRLSEKGKRTYTFVKHNE